MPQTPHLSDAQLAQFQSQGVVKIDGLLSLQGVADARHAVLRRMEALGLWGNGKWRLDHVERPQWPATGLKPARDIGHRHPELEALIDEPAVRIAVEHLSGGGPFDRKVWPRPQILASLPNAPPWSLPGGWHVDAPRLASRLSPGLQLFAFLEPVEPRGGGTLVVAGSHRLLNAGRHLKVKAITSALGAEPFFRQLFDSQSKLACPAVLPEGRVEGVPLKVMELTGQPGDAWLMDLRILHAAAPNGSDRPRLMITHRFVPNARVPEIAEAFGWA
ncbi:phytanoyl-CoA dioxygenase family protein [Phenylobacterium sp.]|uniref:phytanoyl-CoA dioxygenase family protein n=1 Tax=Phenylobacterium sp. TaxID=1871053 RepID=UPI0037C8D313